MHVASDLGVCDCSARQNHRCNQQQIKLNHRYHLDGVCGLASQPLIIKVKPCTTCVSFGWARFNVPLDTV